MQDGRQGNRKLIMELISKTDFKARFSEVLRDIEESGKPRIITDRGIPVLEIRKLRNQELKTPLEVLKGTVVKYEAATSPVDDWENS